MNWTYEWIPVYLHALYAGGYDSWVAWIAYVAGGFGTLVAVACAVGMISDDSPKDEVRWVGISYTGLLALLALWPFIGLLVAYSLPLAVVGFVGWCWFALIPDKDSRISKKRAKVESLRGQATEASRGLH